GEMTATGALAMSDRSSLTCSRSWLIPELRLVLVRALALLVVKALPPPKLSALIHRATRRLKINVVVGGALCHYQVVLVSEIANSTDLTWSTHKERSPTTAELRGEVTVAV